MSRHVSKLDKTIRVIGFSIYLSLVVSLISLFFKDFRFSATLFFISLVYFIIIFTILTKTRNIHFNILIRRKSLEKSNIIYKSDFHLAKLKHFKALFVALMIFLLSIALVYFYRNSILLGVIVLGLAAFTSFYFFIHKIDIYALTEGIVFDYGEFIVLLKWNELKSYKIKGNHVLVYLKEKDIRRGFFVDHPERFEKILKRYI